MRCLFANEKGQVSIVEIKLSHRNLDPLGRKWGGGGSGSCSGDKGFPSLPAVVCRAVGEDHPVSRGQGEPLRGQRLRAANQGASCEAL